MVRCERFCFFFFYLFAGQNTKNKHCSGLEGWRGWKLIAEVSRAWPGWGLGAHLTWLLGLLQVDARALSPVLGLPLRHWVLKGSPQMRARSACNCALRLRSLPRACYMHMPNVCCCARPISCFYYRVALSMGCVLIDLWRGGCGIEFHALKAG